MNDRNLALCSMVQVIVKELAVYNQKFQRDNIFYNEILRDLQLCLRLFCSHLSPQFDINSQHAKTFEDLLQFNLEDLEKKGIWTLDTMKAEWQVKFPYITPYLTAISDDQQAIVLTEVKIFLFCIIKEMRERLPFPSESFQEIAILIP